MGEIFQVFLDGLKGNRFTIDVATNEDDFKKTTIRKLRELVAQKIKTEANVLNVGFEEIRLLFGSTELAETQTFDHYQILNKSNIFMILKLPRTNVTSLLKQE